MRPAPYFALALLFLAAPALATGGFDCRATDGSNIGISGSLGRVVGNPLLGASLQLGERTLSTAGDRPEIAVGRSWIDEREIRVDLIDPQALRFEAQLRARMTRSGATGTLVREGRTYRVRCEFE
jgi:hypothetical protein